MKTGFIGWFGMGYSMLPDFSPELQRFTVRIIPVLALLMGVLMTFASIIEVIGTPFISVFTLGKSAVIQTLLITSVLGIIQGILMIFSFKGLRKRSNKGWKLLFWSQILWIISSIISLSPAIILGFLFLYPLFKVKTEYR